MPKPGTMHWRSQRMKRKKAKKKEKAIPISRWCIHVDFYDAGDTWGLSRTRTMKLPEWMELTGIEATHPTKKIKLYTDGTLEVPQDYKFNASGPTIDTEDAIRAACWHDALYDLRKAGLIPKDKRKVVDKLFYDMLLEDGMCPFRAGYWNIGVRLGGWRSWNN